MKHLSKSIVFILVSLSSLFMISSCNKKLESGVVYEFHSQPQISEVGAKLKTENSEYDLRTKDFSVYFRIFENGLTDLILKSDSINYSFSGEYQFLEGKGEYDNVYSLILNGKDFNLENMERPTMFNFMVDPSDSKVYSMSNGTFPKLMETFSLSELSSEDYKNEYQDGLENSFLPMVLMSFFSEEVKKLDDYWINYLDIIDEKERRTRIIEEKERKERIAREKKERIAREKKEREQKEAERKLNLLINFAGTYINYPMGRQNSHITNKITIYNSGSLIFESTFGDGFERGNWKFTGGEKVGDELDFTLRMTYNEFNGYIRSDGDIYVSGIGRFEKW